MAFLHAVAPLSQAGSDAARAAIDRLQAINTFRVFQDVLAGAQATCRPINPDGSLDTSSCNMFSVAFGGIAFAWDQALSRGPLSIMLFGLTFVVGFLVWRSSSDQHDGGWLSAAHPLVAAVFIPIAGGAILAIVYYLLYFGVLYPLMFILNLAASAGALAAWIVAVPGLSAALERYHLAKTVVVGVTTAAGKSKAAEAIERLERTE